MEEKGGGRGRYFDDDGSGFQDENAQYIFRFLSMVTEAPDNFILVISLLKTHTWILHLF